MKENRSKPDFKVAVKDLRWRPDLRTLPFKTTDQLPTLEGAIIGQKRAVAAIEFGAKNKKQGYNILAIGNHEMGRTTAVKNVLEKIAKENGSENLKDICLIHDFENNDKAKILYLQAGEGKKIQKAVEAFINTLDGQILNMQDNLHAQMQKKQNIIDQEIIKEAETKEFACKKVIDERTGHINYAFSIEHEGEMLSIRDAEEFKSEEEVIEIEEKFLEMQEFIQKKFIEFQNIAHDFDQQLDNFQANNILKIAKEFFPEGKYEGARDHINFIVKSITENFEELFLALPQSPQALMLKPEEPKDKLDDYQINLLVSNKEEETPVVFVDIPDYANIFGGATANPRFQDDIDHMSIKPGAIHEANGGYLVVHLQNMDMDAWHILKRVLTFNRHPIRKFDHYHMGPSLETLTDPIDLDLKVVIIIDPDLFHCLYEIDRDIDKIFKVKAYFGSSMELKKDNIINVAKFIKEITNKENLKPFSRKAVACILEEAVRIGGMQKITTAFSKLRELAIEADFCAKGTKIITKKHVKKAIEDRIYRCNIMEHNMREVTQKGQIMIDADSMKVGQINGLGVYQVPDYAFGQPSKITVTTGMGQKGIVNIEREAGLSDSSYNKALADISGYLNEHFAQNFPITMNASISFEQNYGGIGGDSASMAELITMISSLSNIPIYQGIAVTGSINKKGEVQPIGGVNQKIEGFFDHCVTDGLSGKQGVIIPKSNVIDLMLKEDVINAVKKGEFHIYAVERIDDALQIFMDKETGTIRDDGTYAHGTIYYDVYQKLERYYKNLKK